MVLVAALEVDTMESDGLGGIMISGSSWSSTNIDDGELNPSILSSSCMLSKSSCRACKLIGGTAAGCWAGGESA
jgi:hypothetical protein